jgi:hypothetical protein
MFNPRKPASPFGEMAGVQNKGQYGATAEPKGNGWGQQFMQQYGAPPGQMREQWQQFRQDNGFGGGMGGPRQEWRQQMRDWRQARPERPEDMAPGSGWRRGPEMQGWLQNRPQFGGGQGMDRMAMLRAWMQQRPRGLLGQ